MIRQNLRLRDVASDHHLRELGAAGAGNRPLAGDASGAQHNDLVADIEHFRQLVRNEDDAFAFVPQTPQDVEQIGHFRGREVRCRLIEDEQLGLAQQRFQDLDALPSAEGQIGDAGIWLKVETEPTTDISDTVGDRFPT